MLHVDVFLEDMGFSGSIGAVVAFEPLLGVPSRVLAPNVILQTFETRHFVVTFVA